MWAAIINVLLGVWLMLSPALLHFEKAASDNNYIVGPLVISCAIMALWEVNRSARFFNMAAGIWIVASPFILQFQSPASIWVTVVLGVFITVFSFVKGTIKGNYGGGWKSLFEKDHANT
jgi:hypothetical protein